MTYWQRDFGSSLTLPEIPISTHTYDNTACKFLSNYRCKGPTKGENGSWITIDNVQHKNDKLKRVKLCRLQNILLHTIKDSSCYKSKAWQKHKQSSVFANSNAKQH
jgi:hypothetical protein